MCQMDMFLLFPESDDEILALGEDISKYENICKDLNAIKSIIVSDYKFYYDSSNLEMFVSKSEQLLTDRRYLKNPINQLRELLGRTAVNVSKTPVFNKDCVYYTWHLHEGCALVAMNLFKNAAEKNISSQIGTSAAVVSFLDNDGNHRDILPVIKDAHHIHNLPIMRNLLYFNPARTFIEWYNAKKSNRQFSLLDISLFERTSYIYPPSKQRIYKEKKSGRFWYYDFYHKGNKEHYEVFDIFGNHFAEADSNGVIDESKRDSAKSIRDYIK